MTTVNPLRIRMVSGHFPNKQEWQLVDFQFVYRKKKGKPAMRKIPKEFSPSAKQGKKLKSAAMRWNHLDMKKNKT